MILGKIVPDIWSPGKKIPEKWSSENGPREKWFGKLVPGKMVPENSETKNRGMSVKHRGVCVCVCVECWDVINL